MGVPERDPLAQLSLPPGFRFYPTDEELMVQYLCRKVAGHHFSLPIIGEIDLYKFDPWVLPSKAMFGEKEWYFFSPRDRKYPNGSRPNRVAGSGYWKATGTDKVITTEGRKVGIKKSLVFYVGKAPKGSKTNWIMHEYRLSQSTTRPSRGSKLDDWVLCRIYKKNSSAAKSIASVTSKEQSMGGSSSPSSSSSHLEDVLDSLTEIGGPLAFPGMKSLMRTSQQQYDDKKLGLQSFGSGSLDWSVLAGLTAGPEIVSTGLGQAHVQGGHVINDGSDLYRPSLPPLRHVDSPPVKVGRRMEEEVHSGFRSQGNFFSQSPSMMLGQSYSDSVDPFGVRYTAPMAGFGYSL